MTADEILAALVADAEKVDAIFAAELAMSSGSRRCDLWTISPNSSAGFKATAYEIKISRADFRRDSHAKQREARLYSDQFYYVTPVGMIARAELPDWAGLIEFDGEALHKRVHAPFRDKDAPSWELVVSIIRNSGKVNRDTDQLKIRVRNAERQINEAIRKLKEAGLQPWQYGISQW